MEALSVLSAGAAGAAGLWAAKALSERARRERAAESQAHDAEIAEIVVMAMLADGIITAEEWGVVRRDFGAHGYSLLHADRIIARRKGDADRRRASGELGRWVGAQSADLGEADRELVYEMVVELSLSGSRLTGPPGEYRSADGPPKTFLGLFGDGLQIPDARQREINLAHLRRSEAGEDPP